MHDIFLLYIEMNFNFNDLMKLSHCDDLAECHDKGFTMSNFLT